MKTLLWIEIRRALRDPAFLRMNIISPIVLSLLVGPHVVHETPNGVSPSAYFMVSMAAFSSISAALNATGMRIGKERESGWERRLSLTKLPKYGYPALKLITGAVTSLVPIVVIMAVVVVIMNVPITIGAFLLTTVSLWLGMAVFLMLGFAIGYVLGGDLAALLGLLLHVIFSFVGGLLWPVETFPGWLRPIGEIMPTYHLALIAHAVQTGAAPATVNVLVLAGYLVLFSLLAVLSHRRFVARAEGAGLEFPVVKPVKASKSGSGKAETVPA